MESKVVEPKFKRPVLVGKIGKLPKQISGNVQLHHAKQENVPIKDFDEIIEENEDFAEEVENNSVPSNVCVCPYREPSWSGLPEENRLYAIDILKQGSIIGNLDLNGKPFWVFGRLPQCDIIMAHPTISRFHAVLQYRDIEDEENPKGYYLFDMKSTHGTFLNKLRIHPEKYVRVQVGHMIKLGCSTRMYILSGPAEDAEEESSLTVTQLKEKRVEELRHREQLIEQARIKAESDEIARKRKEEERGIDWGMGDDADEETDLTENPFADESNNEDLYLDDPKKALRGFMEREGYDWEYDCKEQGIGQFLCKVSLPVDDERGRPMVAEVLHKGKKKEAVIQCAQEACRILDKCGLLRQATHESRKRKTKNWEENDYYDSDEDTFLDRTGTIEKKREIRMKSKLPQKAETYESLLERQKTLSSSIANMEKQIKSAKALKLANTDLAEDSLDQYMEQLKQPSIDKEKLMTFKRDLVKYKEELANVKKLVQIAKPFQLPAVLSLTGTAEKTNKNSLLKSKGFFGKRIKLKVEKPRRIETETTVSVSVASSDEEEEDSTTNSTENLPKGDKDKDPLLNIESTAEVIEQIEEKAGDCTEEEVAKKRKKNQKRMQQRQEKQVKEKTKGYEEDANKEDYNMWLPPQNQSGDGKTTLNSKFGY